MRTDLRFALTLACFFLSGFAALLFQTAWTREFAFVFGTSDLAVATVLAGYMAGLAIGAAAAARLAYRVRRPVLVYALLELGIGATALVVPIAIQATLALARRLYGGLPDLPDEGSSLLAAYYLLVSLAILIVPTSLMGATLPLLARDAVRQEREIASRIGALYATNTVGAVAGTLASGFVLLPALGLRTTVWVGAGLNLVVFLLAARISRMPAPPAPAPSAPEPAAAPPTPALSGPALVLPVMLASGAASFGYEVLWTRLLGHLVGGSVYAFATMLASFLTGIALGSAWAARRAPTRAAAARGLAASQLGIALLAMAAFVALDWLPGLASLVGATGIATPWRSALLAAVVLVPSATAIGATFPFAVRVLARDEAEASAASARVYAWNTVGAIGGAIGAGFFLLPTLGYDGTLVAAVATNLLLATAVAIAIVPRPLGRRVALASSLGLLALAFVRPEPPWRLLAKSPMGEGQRGNITYLGVGRSATVMLGEHRGRWTLRTNGLPEAGILPPGMRTLGVADHLLAILPLALHPASRSMLVVGLGGGTALENLPRMLDRVDVIELEREVLTANRAIATQRARDPLADPRVRIHLGDARGALSLTDRRWDVLVSQPSHPWTAGASHLYTREFFELVRTHLEPDGVFLQWIALPFADEPLLRSLLQTLNAVFQNVLLFRPAGGKTLLFVSSDRRFELPGDVAAALASSPEEFADVGLRRPEDVLAMLALDAEGSRRVAGQAPLSTDDANQLQILSPRALRAKPDEAGIGRLLAPYDPLPGLLASIDGFYLVRRLIAEQESARALRVAGHLPDEVERRSAAALAKLAHARTIREPEAGRLEQSAAEALESVLAERPGLEVARFALLELRKDEYLSGEPAAVALASALVGPARAVAEGWRLEAREDWEGLRALEPELAAADPSDPCWSDALALRARWRLELQGAEGAREAIALIDQETGPSVPAASLHLRTRAWLALGDRTNADRSLEHAVVQLRNSRDDRALAPALEALLAASDGSSGLDRDRRQRLEAKLARYHEPAREAPRGNR